MARFLIDANLPYRFSLWQGEGFVHAFDLGDDLPDSEIWRMARDNDWIIVTKDADFSDWVMLSDPPPRVIHFRTGNMRIRDFRVFAEKVWPTLEDLIASHKLLRVFADAVESVV